MPYVIFAGLTCHLDSDVLNMLKAIGFPEEPLGVWACLGRRMRFLFRGIRMTFCVVDRRVEIKKSARAARG